MNRIGESTVLWGDVHNHCNISYGFGSLENALKQAEGQLDFCAVTGHAMWPDMPERTPDTAFLVDFHLNGFEKLREQWPKVLEIVRGHNRENVFTTFYSYEMHGSALGDYHLISPDDGVPLYYAPNPRELLEKLDGYRGIMIPHHAAYPPGYRGIDWNELDPAISPVVEVCSKHGVGMREDAPYPYYHNMGPRDPRSTVWNGLRLGKRFGFVGSTDHHAGYPGSYGDGKMAVLCDSNTRDAIFEAIRRRRTYAVTGDKILCDLRVNGAPMGSILSPCQRRQLDLSLRTCAPLNKVVIYKNLRPIHILNGESLVAVNSKGRYKLRIEMGWGNTADLYDWQGQIQIKNGILTDVETCFRGRSILAPSKGLEAGDEVNHLRNRILDQSVNGVAWECQTSKNISTLHPATCALILEVEGSQDTRIKGSVNALRIDTTVGDLLQSGFAAPERATNSQSVLVHTALPETRYAVNLSLEDEALTDADFYHAEVYQTNGSCAFISPVFFNDDKKNPAGER